MLQLRHSMVMLVWLLFGCGLLSSAPASKAFGAAPPAELTQNKNLTNTLEYQRWWWAFSQRASRGGVIPERAKLNALEQIRQAANKQQKTATLSIGQSASAGGIQGDQWVNLGPAPLLNSQGIPTGGRVANVAVNPRNFSHWLIG